jgi:hypothetical protein
VHTFAVAKTANWALWLYPVLSGIFLVVIDLLLYPTRLKREKVPVALLLSSIVVVPALAFFVAWPFIGLDSALSWASDFVPMAFAAAGCAFSIREVRVEHQTGVIVLLIVVGMGGTVVLHVARERQEARLFSGMQINQGLLNRLNNPSSSQRTPQEAAVERMQGIEKALTAEYIFSHKNISPGLLAGAETPPTDWMNQRLSELGEKWAFQDSGISKPRQQNEASNKIAASPLVGLKFVYPQYPDLVVLNESSITARGIKWQVVLWNMEHPEIFDPLRIPSQIFDFIKPHDESGPEDLFGPVASSLHAGDRLIGCASVDCPDCRNGRTYALYVAWGIGGWYSELKGINGKLVTPLVPMSRENVLGYFTYLDSIVPISERVPIESANLKTLTSKP